MALHGRRGVIALLVVAGLAGCGAPADDLGARIDHSLAKAMRALIQAQSPDGAWRSPTYGAFRDGLALTPTVLKAVAFGPEVEGAGPSRRRGATFTNPDFLGPEIATCLTRARGVGFGR